MAESGTPAFRIVDSCHLAQAQANGSRTLIAGDTIRGFTFQSPKFGSCARMSRSLAVVDSYHNPVSFDIPDQRADPWQLIEPSGADAGTVDLGRGRGPGIEAAENLIRVRAAF